MSLRVLPVLEVSNCLVVCHVSLLARLCLHKSVPLFFDLWFFSGYSIILGLPYAMTELGALKVFVGFVAAQVITSLLWDGFVDGIEMTAYRVLGATLSIAGVVLVSLR